MGYTWDNLNIATQTTERWFMLPWSENLETFRIMNMFRISWATNQTLICTDQAESQRWLVLAYYFNSALWLPTVERHCPLLRSQVFVQQQGCRCVPYTFSETNPPQMVPFAASKYIGVQSLASLIQGPIYTLCTTGAGWIFMFIQRTMTTNGVRTGIFAAEGWMEFWSSSRGRIYLPKKNPTCRRNKWNLFLQ